MSYKDEIQECADELAFQLYGEDFYDLSEKQRDEVYAKAQEAWVDHYTSIADSMQEK